MNGMILTDIGRNLLALALTGKQLVFTRALVGDGSLGSQDPAKLTALIHQKKELPIQSISVTQSVGTCEVVLEMSNKGLTSGFFVREYGLFARNPNTNQEVLYSYCNKGSEAGYLEGDNGVDTVNYTLSLVTVVDQAPNVTAYITNTNQYVTVSRLEQRVADFYAPYQDPAGFWTLAPSITDKRLRPATVQQTRDIILQGVDISGLNGRLERVEDAISQTMLQLEILNDFPGFSHFIAEDFKNTSMLDMFAGKVTSIVAGDDSVDIDPVEGMLPGSVYTITDGVNTETVAVESINLENGIQRVILHDPIRNTYKLASTVIFRTSAKINEAQAVGPSARIAQNWENDFTWQGTGASEDFTVDLDMTAGNEQAFVIEVGSIDFNDVGVGLGG